MGGILECQAANGLRSDQLLRFGLSLFDGDALSQDEFHFDEQFVPNHRPRRVVKPVEEVTAGGGLAESLVRVKAGAGEKVLDLAHGFESLALPGAEAEGTR